MTSADTGAATPVRRDAARPSASPGPAASAAAPAGSTDSRLRKGTSAYRRANLALFAAGLATFALLYSTQALLPALSSGLHLSPAQASLTVTASTGALAVALLPVSALSEKYGRTTVMTASVFGASLLALAVPFAPNLTALVVLRAVQGVALAGLPATAMAYLAEEVHPSAIPSAIGLYVAGNSIGGMSSRVAGGALAQAYGWRAALLAVGLTSLACAVAFRLLAPPARHFTPGPVHPSALWRTVRGHVGDVRLRRLYALGMLFMAVFGAVYTVLGYRLTAAPYHLSQTAVGAIFLVYLVGTGTSAASGALQARLGRRGAFAVALVLCAAGLLVTLAGPLLLVLLGLVLITAGFFTGHSVASGAVSRTATAGRAQASALYLTAYYVGNSVGGSVAASAYHRAGWPAAATVALVAVALCLRPALRRIPAPRR
ncbi:MFS transporter [Streptomyces sp. NPDC020917]|uniref:MFS transporter n=1 Tax=Streptomyces sp. NPDC020917 TaxID=3365102 RepID=UPI0037B0A4B1